jgi:hypothetical protein
MLLQFKRLHGQHNDVLQAICSPQDMRWGGMPYTIIYNIYMFGSELFGIFLPLKVDIFSTIKQTAMYGKQEQTCHNRINAHLTIQT